MSTWTREQIIEPIVQQVAIDSSVPTEEATRLLADWDVEPYVVDGQLAGVAVLNGTEIHAAVRPEWRRRALSRGRLRAFLGPMVERLCYLTTRVQLGLDESFVRRVGFKPTWADGEFQYFMLTGDPFAKE